MQKLSIIIPSYNTKEITKGCLKSIWKNLRETDFLETEIIVVDNGSTDGTAETLRKIKSDMVNKLKIKNVELKIILNKENLGFSKANSQGLKLSIGEYILFINSDVLIRKMDFNKLLNYLDRNQQIGVLTIKVVLPNGEIDPACHRGFPALWRSFCYFLGLERIFGYFPVLNRIFGGYHLTHLNLDDIHEIDSPSGAFYLTRRELLDKVGGFDEDFFMYGEDLDLSFRIKKLGYKIIYYPFFSIIHLKYSSGLKKNNHEANKAKSHFYEAMKIFYKKHYENNNFWLTNKLVYFLINLQKKINEKNRY